MVTTKTQVTRYPVNEKCMCLGVIYVDVFVVTKYWKCVHLSEIELFETRVKYFVEEIVEHLLVMTKVDNRLDSGFVIFL